MIVAILTVIRTSPLDGDDRQRCLEILVSCSSPSISLPQPGDTAEKDTKGKPLADAIALAEDALIKTLQSPEFQDGDSERKCDTINLFFRYYQRIGLEQLASRVSERMLRTLEDAVKDLPLGGRDFWTRRNYDEEWKNGLLEWLKSLQEERNKQTVSLCLADQSSITSELTFSSSLCRPLKCTIQQLHRRELPEKCSRKDVDGVS